LNLEIFESRFLRFFKCHFKKRKKSRFLNFQKKRKMRISMVRGWTENVCGVLVLFWCALVASPLKFVLFVCSYNYVRWFSDERRKEWTLITDNMDAKISTTSISRLDLAIWTKTTGSVWAKV